MLFYEKMSLLNLTALNPYEMSEVIGSGNSDGVACHPSNCKSDIHTSVNNALENMRINNPPREDEKGDCHPW